MARPWLFRIVCWWELISARLDKTFQQIFFEPYIRKDMIAWARKFFNCTFRTKELQPQMTLACMYKPVYVPVEHYFIVLGLTDSAVALSYLVVANTFAKIIGSHRGSLLVDAQASRIQTRSIARLVIYKHPCYCSMWHSITRNPIITPLITVNLCVIEWRRCSWMN